MTAAALLRAAVARWMARRVAGTGNAVVLSYRCIFILPTGQCGVFAVMLALMWIGSINYANSLGFMLTFLLGGLAVAAMNHCARNLIGLRVSPAGAEPVFVGETAVFAMKLESHSRRERVALHFELAQGESAAIDVPAGGNATALLTVPARRRGRLSPGRVVLATRYPTGLFRAWTWLAPATSGVIFPRPETGDVPAPPSPGDRANRGGATGQGDEDFAGLRRYRPGDSIRRIAWKSSRGQTLQVKEFSGEAPQRLWIDWAATEGMDTEARLSRLARWVLDADQQGRVYGLRLPNRSLPPSCGEAHRRQCLTALAVFEL